MACMACLIFWPLIFGPIVKLEFTAFEVIGGYSNGYVSVVGHDSVGAYWRLERR